MAKESNPMAPPKQFVPYCYLSKDADTLTVYFKGDANYSEPLSDYLTLYRSLKMNEIVGCRINGISRIINDLPNYIQINHTEVELSIILLALLAFRGSTKTKDLAKTMNDLVRTASQNKIVFRVGSNSDVGWEIQKCLTSSAPSPER